MKKEIKLPQYEDAPCWYELFLKDETTVGIRMRVEVFAELNQTPWDTAPIICDLIEKYKNLENFTPPGSNA
jgi:hypothetical protein